MSPTRNISQDRRRTDPVPHVTLQLYAGRSDAEKARIADALAKAVMESNGSSEDAVSVLIEDVDPADWPQLYRSITARPERLYKPPGYTM